MRRTSGDERGKKGKEDPAKEVSVSWTGSTLTNKKRSQNDLAVLRRTMPTSDAIDRVKRLGYWESWTGKDEKEKIGRSLGNRRKKSAVLNIWETVRVGRGFCKKWHAAAD